MQMAEELGIPFEGEISLHLVKNFGPTRKAEVHETGFQPKFELEDLFAHMNNLDDPQAVYLVNSQVEWAVHRARWFLVRRDIGAACRSMIELFLRDDPDLSPRQSSMMRNFVLATPRETVVIRRYCRWKGIEPLYYEDIFDRRSTYPNYSESLDKPSYDAIISHCENWAAERMA